MLVIVSSAVPLLFSHRLLEMVGTASNAGGAVQLYPVSALRPYRFLVVLKQVFERFTMEDITCDRDFDDEDACITRRRFPPSVMVAMTTITQETISTTSTEPLQTNAIAGRPTPKGARAV